MPFYEYECTACKFYVEALQKISEEPLRKCPSCKKQTLKRLVSAPVFRLKGGGWYETDFKSDKESKRNLAAGEEAPESKSDAKDSKPAGKAAEAKPAEAKSAEATSAKSTSGRADKADRASKSSARKPAAKPKAPAKPARAKAAAKKKKTTRR